MSASQPIELVREDTVSEDEPSLTPSLPTSSTETSQNDEDSQDTTNRSETPLPPQIYDDTAPTQEEVTPAQDGATITQPRLSPPPPPVHNPYRRDAGNPAPIQQELPPPPQNLPAPPPLEIPPPLPIPLSPALAQSTEESQPSDDDGGPTPEQVCALDGNGYLIVRRVREILSTLVPPLFIELATVTDQDQRTQRAEAQLAASLKKKTTLDMSKALEATLAAEPTVVHANMEGLIGQVVNKKLSKQRKQEEKQLLQKAIKEARKNLWEEAG